MTFPLVSSSLALGPVSIHWYGLLVVVGIVVGYTVVKYLVRRGTTFCAPTESNNLFFWLIIWGFIGGRLYHVLNEPVYYWNHPFDILKVWNGGLAIHGSIVAGVIVIFFFSRKFSINDVVKSFFSISDVLVIGLVLGQAIGRWGNYFNQELFGKPTEGFFKVFIDAAHRPAGFENVAYYHPTFFYESVLNFVLFVILFVYYCRGGVYPRPDRADARPAPTIGGTTSIYLISYGLIRFFIDFLRIDPRPFFGGLYLSQWVSLVMIAVGFVAWYTITRLKVGKSESL